MSDENLGFYRINEITALLGIHKNTWHNWLAAGHVDGIKIPKGSLLSRTVRVFPKSEIHDFFNALTNKDHEPEDSKISTTFGGDEGADIVNALNSIAKNLAPADAYFLTEAVIHIEALYEAAISLEKKLAKATKQANKT